MAHTETQQHDIVVMSSFFSSSFVVYIFIKRTGVEKFDFSLVISAKAFRGYDLETAKM
jgi:hypothetical protein